MASISDTTLTFFTKASPDQWSYVLSVYRDVFKHHAEQTRSARKNGPADLIKLDVWYQDTLPQVIRSRQDQMLLYDEIVQVTKWRMLRGKFRPSILDLVKTNTETAVKNVTKKAFKKMPNINAAITALTQLKGVSSATASAILVAHSPELCPYMADENMASTPGVEASNNTTAEYLNYVTKVQECVDKLKNLDSAGQWTPHKIELAMWTHFQIKQYNLTLIESMPVRPPAEGEHQSANDENEEANSLNECSNGLTEQRTADDENQVGSSELDALNCNSSSNLVSSNKSANDEESSQHGGLNNGRITQSDNESVSNSLSSTSFGLPDTNSKLAVADSNDKNSNHYLNVDSKVNSNVNSNVNSSSVIEEDASNLSSPISSNSEEPSSVQLNKVGSAGEDDSSSNNVSSTNGISRAKEANCVISNGNDESNNEISNDNEVNNNESSSSEPAKVGSSLIKQQQQQHHFQIIRPQANNNVDSNLSLPNTTNDSSEKFSTISSSCENSSNNPNSSEDSLLLAANSRKRRNSSSSNSLSNLKASRTKNCNADALDLNLDDNAVSYDPDSEQLGKRQKLIN